MNMQKLNILLLVFIFEFACVVKSQEPQESYEGKINANDAAKLLHELEPGKALPLVLFRLPYYKYNTLLFLPRNLYKVNSLKGKMIPGTEFTIKWEDAEQMFFCPKNDGEKCLVSTSFGEREALECASEPIPISEPENKKCGNEKKGSSRTFMYQICEGQIRIDTKIIPFYRYCYDENQQQTLYTVHTIESPTLLTATLLLREREVTYPIIMNDGTKISIKRGADGLEVYDLPKSKRNSSVLGYRWRTIVQFNDMALALWRKPLFHEKNFALQHEKLIKIWDNIGEYVRSNAIQSLTKDRLLTKVFTGVFDLKSESKFKNNDQLLNIWVKLILTESPMIIGRSFTIGGVAILMNNFIDSETNLDGIETYCEQDICIQSLKDELSNVKGNVRCCLVTKEILNLFDHQYIEVEELFIPKVNLGEDQEFLRDEQMKDETKEQPVESLREIQPHEILPIILYLYEDEGVFKLRHPTHIKQIITKNKRIVDGSHFVAGNVKYQLFFCPKEDSNETCLVPRKFGRFEALQCTKQPVPEVKKALTPSDEEIQCGTNGNGTLYKVVYEFCTNVPLSYKFKNSDIEIYQFCYDSNERQILYTRHEPLSEYLLNSKLLFWERQVEFPMTTDKSLPLYNLIELQNAIKEENTNQSVNRLQKLVPSEDMPFASWKIPTNLLVNLAFQHESLIPLWKEINRKVNDYIREIGSTHVVIYNGERAKSEIWFKVIQKKRGFRDDEAVAIFMKNSILFNSEDNTLKQYCETDICLEKFRNKFNKIGGQVRCCRLTTKIIQTFGIPDVHKDTVTLRIPDIIIHDEDDSSY